MHTRLMTTGSALGPNQALSPQGVGDFSAHAPVNGPVDLHPALEQVRRLPEFQPPQPNPLEDWLKQPWLQKLSQQWGQFVDSLIKNLLHLLEQARPPGMQHLPTNIQQVAVMFIGFVLVLLSLYALYVLLGSVVRWREARADKKPTAARLFEEKLLISAAHHYEQARHAALIQQYGEAVRQLYMASLCLLDERGIVPYETARSNREYLHSLADYHRHTVKASQAPLQTSFEKLARAFEASRYGEQGVNVEQFASSESDYQQLQAEVSAHG